MKPDYQQIAGTIFARNCTVAGIATALSAAYDQGRADAEAEDQDAAIRRALQERTAKIDALSAKIEGFVRDLRAAGGSEPADVTARTRALTREEE